MAVANPLEFAKEREVVKGQHKLDHNVYVPDPGFQPATYPKWMYRDKKARTAANEEEELALIELGWTEEAPKDKVLAEV